MQSNANKLKLRKLTNILLDPSNIAYQLRPEVETLTNLLEQSAKFSIDLTQDIAHGETNTVEGLAISPMMASMCAQDFVRTIMFIRGLNNAIADRLDNISSRPIHVLYAGCGPFAIQAVPLMAKYPSSEVQFTLLDIHQSSLTCVRRILKDFALDDSVCNLINIDAANYIIEASALPDIIVMEIMQNCLFKEPQVKVSRHLVEQAPLATLVPQKITIELALVNINEDLKPCREHSKPLTHKTLEEVFKLSKSSILEWQKQLYEKTLPGKLVTIPDNIEDGFNLMLKTNITVFAEHQLKNYDSGLTTPQPFSKYSNASVNDKIRFAYELGECPKLTVEFEQT